MFFILFVWSIVALVIASATSQRGRSRIGWLLIFVPTVVGASTASTQEQGLVPRGTLRPSFDCVQAKTAAARLICADRELTRLDGELGTAFQRWKTHLPESDQPGFVASQLAWIRGRNARCGLDGKSAPAIEVLARSKSCMASEIRERITDLSSSSGPERPNLAPSTPSSADEMSAAATAAAPSPEPVSRGTMPINFVGDWCSPFRDKGQSMYTLPSWTDEGKCTDILSINKYGFYFSSEKVHCEPENMQLGEDTAPSGTAYMATVTARCQPDGPVTAGKLRTFEFRRYKGNLTITTKSSGPERPNPQGAGVPAAAPSAPTPTAGDAAADASSRTQAAADSRKHNVDTCTESVDLVNELIRSGTVTGRETVGEQRKAKINACVADSEGKLQAAPSDAELLVQERTPEANSLGTTVMMLHVMVNCNKLRERDAEVLINAELRKLKAIDPRVQLKIAARAKLQAEGKTNPHVCARLDEQDVYRIQLAVREEEIRAEARDGQTQASQPSAKQNSYANIYYNEVRRQKLEELDREIRTMYFAIGCGVIDEERAARGLLSAKMGLVWPEAGSPLFNLSQPHQFVGGQRLFDGIPPETVDATYMSARRAGLVAAGADPDARVVREFRTGVPDPPMAIPLYSGQVGANCEYWREHPENVTSVYSLANFLNRRAGWPGYP